MSLEVTDISLSFDWESIKMISFVLTFRMLLLWTAEGHGAKGQNDYAFSLEFVLPVKQEVCAVDCLPSPKYLLVFFTRAA